MVRRSFGVRHAHVHRPQLGSWRVALSPEDQPRLDAVIIAHLDERIPVTFLGWSTRIKLADANAPDADAEGRRPAACGSRRTPDVWLDKIACQWVRVGQDQAFVGRCGDVSDDIGSRIITARLARDVMRLCFLVERRYVPYPTWFGTAFARLSCAREMSPLIGEPLRADDRRGRETPLAEACRRVADLHVREAILTCL
jgi:hypothetical protein